MRKLFSGCVAVVTASVAAAFSAPPVTAAPAVPAATARALGSAPGSPRSVTYRVSTPDGTLTYGWRPVTSTPQGPLRPASASGCNQDVCLSIVGTGNYVSDWSTTAYWDGGYICTHSFWSLNDRLIRTGNGACGRAGVFFSDWSPRRGFPYPSLACNTWQVIPGRPCETIKK
jgi:hypothetical protein